MEPSGLTDEELEIYKKAYEANYDENEAMAQVMIYRKEKEKQEEKVNIFQRRKQQIDGYF